MPPLAPTEAHCTESSRGDAIREALDRAGCTEILFDRCADSLDATRLAVALSAALGRHVPLREILHCRSRDELVIELGRLLAAAPIPLSVSLPLDHTAIRRRRHLSFSQERMAFLHAMSAGSTAYHVAFGLRLRGAVDEPALARALDQLPRHFPVLATRYVPGAAGLVPLSIDPARVPFTSLQLPPGEDDEEALARAATAFCQAPFEIESGETFRAAWIVGQDGGGLLVLLFVHVVIDQWAWELLLARLARAYREETGTAQAEATPAPAVGHGPYSMWHRAWFRAHAFEPGLAYWRERLAGAQRVSFDPDLQRPQNPGYRGARHALVLEESRWQALEELAGRHDSTLCMLLLTLLAVELYNHSGEEDLVIGLPVANRNHVGAPECPACLVNTVPLRIGLSADARLTEVLAQVRQRVLEALDQQDMPFEVLVDQLRLPRTPGASPLFGVMLNMLSMPTVAQDFGALEVRRCEIDRGGAQFDLTLTVDRQHTRTIWFEYALDLYRPATIQRIAARFEALLDAALSDAGQAIHRLPHRTAQEAGQAAAFRTGPAADPAPPPVAAQFAAAAAKHPDRVACRTRDGSLTYAELTLRVAALAAQFGRVAHRHGSRVGLLLERQTDLPVAVLSALAAGVTFVPLDSALPEERLAFIASDAGLSLFLVQDHAAPRPAWIPDAACVTTIDLLLQQPAEADTVDADAGTRAAYILYTSGSTGQPKGVEIPERALAQFLLAMRVRPGLDASDRLLAITTLTFDIALLELLLPLTSGATLCIAARGQVRDSHLLAAAIEDFGITVMQATPSAWSNLLDSGWQGRPGLRAFSGGEALSPELALRLRPRVHALWNLYGPTETTIWSCCGSVEDPAGVVDVGTPIAGTFIDVIDSCDRPAGIGDRGEIVIGGSGLASGYLNLPELTAQRFVALPSVPGGNRLYRTGDIGSWTPDGRLRVQGRSDRQVKLRGHRIEPGEIEACALRVPGVSRAVALMTGADAEAQLHLYIVATDRTLDSESLRQALRRWLPDYMLPNRYVVVDAFPQLPNGKLDLRGLAAIRSANPREFALRAPSRPEEADLLAIWKELLDLEDIGCDDDFFSLGGHSLLAMRLVVRIREDLQRQCSLAQVFRHPTIARLALALTQSTPLSRDACVVLEPDGRGAPLFCICGIQIYRPLVAQLQPDGPVFATYIGMDEPPRGTVALQPSHEALVALAGRYAAMIRAQVPRGPCRLLGFSLGGVLAYEIARQLGAAGQVVERIVILDSDVPGGAEPSLLGGLLKKIGSRLRATPIEAGSVRRFVESIRHYRAEPCPGPAIFVEATRAARADPGYGWDRLITQLTVLQVDCDHLELMSARQAAVLGPALQEWLYPPVASAAGA